MYRKNIISQYIDTNGKVRTITFEENILMITSPMEVIWDVEESDFISDNLFSTIENVKKLIKKYKNFQLESQYIVVNDSNKKVTKGLWLQNLNNEYDDLKYGFIFVQESEPIKNIPETNYLIPLPLNISSKLKGHNNIINFSYIKNKKTEYEKYKYSKIISQCLKDSVLFLSSYKLSTFNSSKINNSDFVINKNYTYNIENFQLHFDNSFFEKDTKKIIVLSESMRQSLIDFYELQKINNYDIISTYKNNNYYDTKKIFNNTNIFKKNDNYLLFNNVEQLKPKIFNKDVNNENNFYIEKVNKYIFFLQKLDINNYNNALKLSYLWITKKINIGYNSEELNKFEDLDINKIKKEYNIKILSKDKDYEITNYIENNYYENNINLLKENNNYFCILYIKKK